MILTKRQANSRNAALLPSPESCPAIRVATSEIRPNRPIGVVARGNLRPAEMKDVKFAFAPGALGLNVHALEQVCVTLRIEDDANFVLAVRPAPNVLRDEELGQTCLAHTRRP